MEREVKELLSKHGFSSIDVEHVLEPLWTTDKLQDSARQKLKESGIAPPGKHTAEDLVQFPKPKLEVACPRCGCEDTDMQSSFGPTACKSLFVCKGCKEPFEYFKALQ